MDAPTHIHGWHRYSRRSRDQRRTRRQLRVCPAVTRRHLDRFIRLYEDTVWVNDTDIEREASVDPGVDEEEQPTGGQDKSWAMERRDATTQEIAKRNEVASTSTSAGPSIMTDMATTPSISTSTGAYATTLPKSDLLARTDMSVHLARDKDPTAHDEIKASTLMERHKVTTQENGGTNGTPSTSTAAGVSTMNQPKPKATGEVVQTEYNSELFSSLDWFFRNKERLGSINAPGGSSGRGL